MMRFLLSACDYTVYYLRNNPFNNKLRKAVETLNNARSAIGVFTAKVIQSRWVKVFPFYKIPSAFFEGDESYSKLKMGKRVIPKKSMLEIRKKARGFQEEQLIYIDQHLDLQTFVSTLVHEVNHYLNCEHFGKKHNTNNQQFMLEYKAYLAEELYKTKLRTTRANAKRIAKEVAEDYKLKQPKRLKFPVEPFYIDVPETGEKITSKSRLRPRSNR